MLRDLLAKSLTGAGFQVVEASDGTRANAELDAAAGRFGAVVTDIRLGPGPDGWAVARHARALAPGVPVVYVSGDSLHDWPQQGVPDSARLTKPFKAAALIRVISGLLDKTRACGGAS